MLPRAVLYAEDDQDSAFFMRKAFQKAAIAQPLHVVEDGALAVDALEKSKRAGQPSAVFLDINLPRRDGLEVLAWIRQQPEYRSLPVFVLSASGCDDDRRRAVELGASAFFTKPASPRELADLVRTLSMRWEVPAAAGRA